MTLGRLSLARAFDTAETKRLYVRRLFTTIARRYDLITVLLSFGRDRAWKRRLIALSGAGPGSRVLDLACGTGDLALAAAETGAAVVGLDVTAGMIDLARRKASATRVRWVVADMTALPFRAGSFDLVTTGYGLRNVPDLPTGLDECRRVLAPGGRLCSLDFDRPERRWKRRIFVSYLTGVGSILGWLLHRDPDTYRYIPASVRRYPGSMAVATMMTDTGFATARVVPVFGGFMAIHVAERSAVSREQST